MESRSPTSNVPVARASPSSSKKYVTRACDICKKRKCKCDGRESGYEHSPTARRESITEPAQSPNNNEQGIENEAETRLSTETEEDAAGDASTHTFLKSVYTHLQSLGQVLPRNLQRPAEQILEGESPASIFFPPDRKIAQECIDCFFEHSNATYRYIPRSQVQGLLEAFYAQDEGVLGDDAKSAVFLLVLAVGCIWLASWRGRDLREQKAKSSRMFNAAKRRLEQAATVYPPNITVLQGHVLECQFYLALNMFNTAWMSLGKAIRLGQMAGFQKGVKRGFDLQEFSRRGIFWSIYMMERYLSAALGRPMALDDADITIPYPEVPPSKLHDDLGKNEARLAKGVVAHIKLTQITSKILKQLYPANQRMAQSREQIVLEIENYLQDWLRETPSFFHPSSKQNMESEDDSIFCDVPWIFKRQQRTVQNAFNFNTILLYRGYLLDELLQPTVPRRQPPRSNPAIERCVEAALRLASFAADVEADATYNSTYWTTTHITFCAISILTVYMTLYDDPKHCGAIEAVFEKAMRGHRKLDNSRNMQSQRLLEESRSIAKAIQASPINAQPQPAEANLQQPYHNLQETANPGFDRSAAFPGNEECLAPFPFNNGQGWVIH
ncbi:fungal-specific transcription factor domain-containing protein [Aspergillus filifer]